MSRATTPHTRMTDAALRIERPKGAVRARSASAAGLPMAPSKASPCVLDLLGYARPQSPAAVEALI